MAPKGVVLFAQKLGIDFALFLNWVSFIEEEAVLPK